MSVPEAITFGIQKQLLNGGPVPAEANESFVSVEATVLEMDMSLQQSEADDIVTLSSTEQGYSQYQGVAQLESGQTIQEISSVAQAASAFSQVVEGNLNKDELAAIQNLTPKVELIARDILSGDPEEFDVEQAIDKALPDVALEETEISEFNVENIRQLPTLVSATIDAGFEKQFQTLNATSRELIVNSLSELMKFFREKVVQVLEPLRHPNSLAAGTNSQVPVEVDLTA